MIGMISVGVTFRNSKLVEVTGMYFPCPKSFVDLPDLGKLHPVL